MTPDVQQVNKGRPPAYIPPATDKASPLAPLQVNPALEPMSPPQAAPQPPYHPPPPTAQVPPASPKQPAPKQESVNASSLRQELEDLLAMLK
jgi:hypothetical protein